MIDCFNGLVISWSIGTRSDAHLVNTMLAAAIETVVHTSDRPVMHSDCGAHLRFKELSQHQLVEPPIVGHSMLRQAFSIPEFCEVCH